MNSFILDFQLLKEQDLELDEFTNLIRFYTNDKSFGSSFIDQYHTLEEKGFIKIIDNEIIIREKGKILLDLVTIDSDLKHENKKIVKKSSRTINNELDEFIEEYRSLWKGLKPGSMGSLEGCREKMSKWMSLNTNYSKEDILKAARIYLKSLDDYKYLQAAHYFIYKDGDSRLSAFVDEEEVNNTDWTSKIN